MSNKLDRLVADKVMGNEWRVSICPNTYGSDGCRDGGVDISAIPHFSSDIAAAWGAVEKMGLSMLCVTAPEMHGGDRVWQARRWVSTSDPCAFNHKSACVAACVCALRACGVPESEITEAMQ